jgi:hypothetical protein
MNTAQKNGWLKMKGGVGAIAVYWQYQKNIGG